MIDEEVAALLVSAEGRARELLSQREEALRQLTIALLDQETISGEQVRDLVQAASSAQE
jgi:ATP-dependent Zn protease